MSCVNNFSDINETFIIEPMFMTGESATWTACTGVYTNMLVSCDGDAYINLSTGETRFNTSIVPVNDGDIDLGSVTKRFRDINTISGTTTVWTSSVSLTTPNLILGIDSEGENRIITANNSIIQNDILSGGNY